MEEFQYVVVGGGIAGVTCVETLAQQDPDSRVLLLSASDVIKTITNYNKLSKVLEEFDVAEKPYYTLTASCPNVIVRRDTVAEISSSCRTVSTAAGKSYKYDKLCICSGGKPNIIAPNHPHVIGIRDTETVKEFQHRLQDAERIIVVGNGGIATELVYEIQNCQVVWAIKDKSISSTFVDVGAATFFLPQLNSQPTSSHAGPSKRLKYTTNETSAAAHANAVGGSALGPDWSTGLDMRGRGDAAHQVVVEYEVQVQRLLTAEEMKSQNLTVCDRLKDFRRNKTESSGDWPVYVELTNGHVYGVDFVISATGVQPATEAFLKGHSQELKISGQDGGILVNDRMMTSLPDVFAAGDACSADWPIEGHWMQMRLWSQARQMGHYAAKSMVASTRGEDIPMDFCFELFAHVTKFFNYKVVLLGLFNAQGLAKDEHELLVRVSDNREYVKVVVAAGRMVGAVLVGETDLEETFENLILNQTEISMYGEDLLDPNIDIEDYFD